MKKPSPEAILAASLAKFRAEAQLRLQSEVFKFAAGAGAAMEKARLLYPIANPYSLPLHAGYLIGCLREMIDERGPVEADGHVVCSTRAAAWCFWPKSLYPRGSVLEVPCNTGCGAARGEECRTKEDKR